MTYDKHFSTRATPQSEPIPGRESEMVKGRAGGQVFGVDDWTRLARFLILGAEAPTYYAGQRELVKENATAILRLIQTSSAAGVTVVDHVVAVSEAGRAPSNDPALFVLAMASAHGDQKVRQAAFEALPKVARIGTHLFTFLNYRQAFGGWGRGMKRAVSKWYLDKPIEQLAYQLIKYRQRAGWTHRDALRQAHPEPTDFERDDLFSWVADPSDWDAPDVDHERLPRLIQGFIKVQNETDPIKIATHVTLYGLPREALPTEALNHPEVWDALLHAGKGMPVGALLRNLGNLSKHNLLVPFTDNASFVRNRITDPDVLRKARVHPYSVLVALLTYSKGRGYRGDSSWRVNNEIVDALEGALHMTFDNVEPTGKRTLLALDVSGSMGMSTIRNSVVSAREGAAVMALVTAKVEPNYQIFAFSDRFMPLDLSKTDSFRSAVKKTSGLPFMGTDCALPMLYAMGYGPEWANAGYWDRGRYTTQSSRRIDVDTFIIYTDSETWAGHIHPTQALQRYREQSGIDAKLIVVAMTSNGFSIADPKDHGMLDVVGFDTAAPQVIANFAR